MSFEPRVPPTSSPGFPPEQYHYDGSEIRPSTTSSCLAAWSVWLAMAVYVGPDRCWIGVFHLGVLSRSIHEADVHCPYLWECQRNPPLSGRLVDLSFTGYTMAECALFKKSHGHHGLPMQSELAVLLPEHTYTKRKAMVSLAGKTVVRKSAQQSTRQLRPLAPFAPPSPWRLWVVHGHLFGRWALVRCGEATGYSQVEATQPRPSQTRAKPPSAV